MSGTRFPIPTSRSTTPPRSISSMDVNDNGQSSVAGASSRPQVTPSAQATVPQPPQQQAMPPTAMPQPPAAQNMLPQPNVMMQTSGQAAPPTQMVVGSAVQTATSGAVGGSAGFQSAYGAPIAQAVAAPTKFISYSEGYMQGQAKPQYAPGHSLQHLNPSTKSIVLADRTGIPKQYSCNDPTMTYIRNLLESGGLPDTAYPGFQQPAQQLPYGQGLQQNPSLGSLPSATSQYSSSSSITTQPSQAAGYGHVARVDAMTAIQQYCDQLAQSGRTQELTQVKQYVDMTFFGRQPHQTQLRFPDAVSNSIEPCQVDSNEVHESNIRLSSEKENISDSSDTCSKELVETSSEKQAVLKKPKFGAIKKVNLFLSRIFAAKL